MTRKGIILAGGSGTRLWPMTATISKQLLPIWDKPMIYYPLTTLMSVGIQEILIISTPRDLPRFTELLGDGSEFGISLTYELQEKPNGIAEALIIAQQFLNGAPSALILGDNIFHGREFQDAARNADASAHSTVIACHVADPERYGVVTFDNQGQALNIQEKPREPKSTFAVTGLYFYSDDAPMIAKSLTPSERGELEISDLNQWYLQQGRLQVQTVSNETIWLDTGTNQSYLQATQLIEAIQTRQGLIVGSPEEIGLKNGWISYETICDRCQKYPNSGYAKLLLNVLKENRK